MSIRKKITLSASVLVIMLMALIVGMVSFNTINTDAGNIKTPVTSGVEDNSKTEKPSVYTYQPGEVKFKTGTDILDFKYEPRVNLGEGETVEPKTIAYEYIFKGVMDDITAINLKDIDTTNVIVRYAYSDTQLDDTSKITGEDTYTIQEIKTKDAKKYVYVLVTPPDEKVPTNFTTSIKWYVGKLQNLIIKNNINDDYKTVKIVEGQEIDVNTLTPPTIPNGTFNMSEEDSWETTEVELPYHLDAWFLDDKFTQMVEEPIIAGQQIYARFHNLPLDSNLGRGEDGNYGMGEVNISPVIVPTVWGTGEQKGYVTYVGGFTLDSVTGNGKIILPSTLVTLGSFEECYPSLDFSSCVNLTSMSVGSMTDYGVDGVLDLSNCTSMTTFDSAWITSGITTLILPKSITDIKIGGLVGLEKIIIDPENPVFKSTNDYTVIINKQTNELVYTMGNSLPEGVTSIGDYAFAGKDLGSFTLPSTLVSIGNYAFANNKTLTSIDLGRCVNLVSIGDYAFSGCTNLTTIGDLSTCSKLTTIGDLAFHGISCITSVTIPKSVTSIGDAPFNGYALTSIAVEEGNTSYKTADNGNILIETSTNRLVQGLANSTIPSTVQSIGNYAFYRVGLTSADLSKCNLSSIGDYAFYGNADLTSIDLSNSTNLTSIGEDAFYGISNLASIDLIKCTKLTTIGDYAFRQCSKLPSINLGSCINLENIGAYAFYGCSILASVGDLINCTKLTNIGQSAFTNCNELTSIAIPSSVQSIGNRAFTGCTKLTSVYITDLEAWCNISFGSAGSPLKGNLYLNNQLVTEITIPEGVTSINYAFSGCDSLESVTIPKTVTRIGSSAFNGCDNLTTLTFEDDTSWYQTPSMGYTGGAEVDVSDPSQNATLFKEYGYWYYIDRMKVTINANGGTLGGLAISYITKDKNAIIGTLPTPVYDGYVFLGWFTDESAGIQITESYEVNEDITIYAHWAKKNVTLNTNGGTFEGVESANGYEFANGEGTTTKEILFTLENTTDAGNYGFWYDDAMGYYSSGNTYCDDSYALAKITFTAKAGDIITFYAMSTGEMGYDYGIFSTLNHTLMATSDADTENVHVKFSEASETEQEYTAVTYTIDTTGEYFIYVKYRKDSSGSSESGDSLQIKDKITVESVTIDYTSTTIYVEDGGSVDTIANPVREGYTFLGWFTEVEGGTQVTEISGEMTVYAHWQEN